MVRFVHWQYKQEASYGEDSAMKLNSEKGKCHDNKGKCHDISRQFIQNFERAIIINSLHSDAVEAAGLLLVKRPVLLTRLPPFVC